MAMKTGYADYDRRQELLEEYDTLDSEVVRFDYFLIRKILKLEARASRYEAALQEIIEDAELCFDGDLHRGDLADAMEDILRIAKGAKAEAE